MVDLFPVQKLAASAEIHSEEFQSECNTSANSDSKQEKYSLRPRSLRQKTEKGLELKNEILSQRNRKNHENGKPKQKPPPLSKYRRKTANARERNRMREINVAFETLRRAVPHISGSLNSGNEKLTKITTLRLAMKYIQTLRQILERTPGAASAATSAAIPATPATTLPSPAALPSLALAVAGNDDADLDALLSDGESLHFHSDVSDSFASPDHPLTSPFSELSASENSPDDFCGVHDFSFGDSVMSSDFCFDGDLTDSEFCREFLNGHCFEGLS